MSGSEMKYISLLTTPDYTFTPQAVDDDVSYTCLYSASSSFLTGRLVKTSPPHMLNITNK